jgi:hypothetical protein
MMSARAWPVGLVLLASLAAGCSRPKDPIQELLDGLEDAAEDRSTSDVLEWLAPEFQAPQLGSRADAAASLRRYFAAYETVNLEIYEVQTERDDAGASVRFRVDFNGEPLKLGSLAGFMPPSAMYRFKLRVRPGDEHWLVTAAEWEELGLGTPTPQQ